MSESSVWWILVGCMVGLELLTGTFYLLMIAVGLVAGALAAYAGVSLVAQLMAAALVGGGAVVFWHWRRDKHPARRATANKDVNLDIGETVDVLRWDDMGQTEVQYRGAQWAAKLAQDCSAHAGPHQIVEVLGNRLILKPRPAHSAPDAPLPA